jgi:periplasmic protein CpxP/Spy
MKKSLCSLALSGLLMIAGTAAFAQSDAMTQQPPAGAMERRGMDPDTQLARMTKALSLTPDQANQIKPILVDRDQQMKALHQDQSMSQSDKMAKMKSIRDDSSSKIQAVLNDTQKQKFQQMMARQQDRMQQGPPPAQQQ